MITSTAGRSGNIKKHGFATYKEPTHKKMKDQNEKKKKNETI